MTDRRAAALALGVLAAVTLFLFWPLFAGLLTGAPRFFEWDVPEQYWPDLVALCRSMHSFDLPLWNPWDRGGYPMYADPQAGLYHPLNHAICAIAGADPGPAWAIARVPLGFFAAGAFGLAWLRRLRLGWGPALLGAAVIQTAPFMRHNWELNLTAALAWMPAMLWAAEGLATRRRLRDAAALALATGLCVQVGSPPAAWQAGTYTLGYLLFRLAVELRAHGREAVLRPMVTSVAWAATLTAAVTAVVLLPASTLARHSVQHGRSFDDVAAGALEPSQLVALVWPQPGNHLYVGIAALALGIVALLDRSGRRPGWQFFVGSSVVAVALSLGASTPLFGLAYDLVPGVDRFRLPHRYEAWLGPSAGALAAFGLQSLATRPGRIARLAALPAVALLVFVHCLDVSREMPTDRHTRAGVHPGTDAAAVARAPAGDDRYRYVDEFGISCRSGTRLARRELRGYQDPLQLAAFERVIGSLREHPRLAEQHSVRWALTGPHFIHGWDRHFLPPPAELLSIEGAVDHGGGVIELPKPNPPAWFVPAPDVVLVPDRAAALDRVRAVAPALVAILEVDPSLEESLGGHRPTAATSFRLQPDRVHVEVDAPTAGVVVVNEAWYPGWTATVDGTEAAVVRANGFVRGIAVPAGATTIELRFHPRDALPLRVLWLMGMLGCTALLLGAGSKHDPKLPPSPPPPPDLDRDRLPA